MNESLRGYVKRFSETLNRVEKSTDSTAIMAYKVGLRSTRFAVKIVEEPLVSMSDLYEKHIAPWI